MNGPIKKAAASSPKRLTKKLCALSSSFAPFGMNGSSIKRSLARKLKRGEKRNDDRLIGILKNIGVKTARTVDYGIQPIPAYDADGLYKLKCVPIGRDTDPNLIYTEVDRAIETGSSLFFMLHMVEITPDPLNTDEYSNLAVSVENLRSIVDYIVRKQGEGLTKVVTISEWYEAYKTMGP